MVFKRSTPVLGIALLQGLLRSPPGVIRVALISDSEITLITIKPQVRDFNRSNPMIFDNSNLDSDRTFRTGLT